MKSIRKLNSEKTGNAVWSFIRALLIIGISFLIIYPIFVKLMTSFKSPSDMYDPTVYFLPKHFTLDNFKTVWIAVDYPMSLLKTVGYVLLISGLQIASCALTAYGFARFNFPGRGILFSLVIITLVIPPQMLLLPLYLRFRFFNPLQLFAFGGTLDGISLIDTVIPFVLMSVTATAFKNGLYIFMLRQHFKNVPQVLEEAAYIDGCGVYRTFFKIILPGAVPMLATVFLFSFVWTWNDYYYTQILAPGLPTLNNTLMNLNFGNLSSLSENLQESMLSAPKFLLLILPLVILYLFTQRLFTESIQKSGIVG